MKNLLKLTLFAALFVVCSSSAYAQKFGYINSQELISLMPERDSAVVQFNKFQEELESQMETIQVEFNTKYMDYQKNSTTMTDGVRQMKEKELQDLQRRLDEFGQAAQQDLQEMQQKLMTPIIEKAQAAIKKVGKAHSMTMVFDISVGAVVYNDEATTTDILPLVKKELGITK